MHNIMIPFKRKEEIKVSNGLKIIVYVYGECEFSYVFQLLKVSSLEFAN